MILQTPATLRSVNEYMSHCTTNFVLLLVSFVHVIIVKQLMRMMKYTQQSACVVTFARYDVMCSFLNTIVVYS